MGDAGYDIPNLMDEPLLDYSDSANSEVELFRRPTDSDEPIASASDDTASIGAAKGVDVGVDDNDDVAVDEQPAQDDNEMVILQVSESQFTTTRATLTNESTYFQRFFTTSESPRNTKPMRIFIDADPDIFRQILRYLRRSTYPLLYSQKTGFDLGTYANIQREAEHFGISRLASWIEKQTYLDAVKTTYRYEECEDLPATVTTGGNTEITHHVSWPVVQEYVCPRGIACHADQPERCGRACEQARSPGDSCYAGVSRRRILVVHKTTVLS